MDFTFPVLNSAVTIMTPVMLAAMGGLFTELAGMLNIALEGLLLMSAFASIVFAHFTGSLLIGVLLGIAVTMILAAVMATVTLRLKSNVFITGLAINLFAAGITVVLAYHLFDNKGVVVFETVNNLKLLTIPSLASIPIIGDVFIGHSIFVYLSWALLFVCWFVLNRTPFGFRLAATGKYGETLRSLGMAPDRYRFIAFLISGFACGIGGAFLTLNMGAFVSNISAGKGWIALVVIFLGNKRPLGLLLAAFVFGMADSFSNYAQGVLHVPTDFILAIPYIFTLIAMVGYSIYAKKKNEFQK
ncbi:MAG: ABC transporter permease [Spirochaetota bacterium]